MLADVAPGYDVYCTAPVTATGAAGETFGGTSASTPLMAGGFALIDELLRRQDEQSLGLAEPAALPPGAATRRPPHRSSMT